MCHLQNNNINQKHSHWTSVGNGLACLSATACQLHFRKSSGSGAAFRNVLKGFQGMYKISKIISGATTIHLSTSGPSQAGGVSQQQSCEIQGGSMQTPGPLREKPCKGGGWGWLGWGAALCWCPGELWTIQQPADTRQRPSMHLGIALTPSTLHSCGQIQCLVLGLPQYKTRTGWFMLSEGPSGWSGLEQLPVRRGWGMGCLSLGQRRLQGDWRREAQFPLNNGTTTLILLLCTPFLIKPHTKGCVICQHFILTVLERRGDFMWMERQDISSLPGKGKSTAWGATGATVSYLDPWLLNLPHVGKCISVLHFLEGWGKFCCHMHSARGPGKIPTRKCQYFV